MDTGPNCGFAGYPDCFVYSGFQVVELVPHRRTLQLAPPVGEIAEGDTVTFTASSTDGRPITVRSWIWQDSLGVSSTPACSISSPRCTIVAGSRGRMYVRARVGTNTFVEQANASLVPSELYLTLIALPHTLLAGDSTTVMALSSPLGRAVTSLSMSAFGSATLVQCSATSCDYRINGSTSFSGSALVNGIAKQATLGVSVLEPCPTPSPAQPPRSAKLFAVPCNYPACDPRDGDCYVPLTGADSLLLVAVTQYLRPLSSITDASTRSFCAQAFSAFTVAFQQGRVFRGRHDGPLRDGSYHYATTHQGLIHVDPVYLRTAALPLPGSAPARRFLLNVLLHEGLHLLLYDHDPARFSHVVPWSHVYPRGLTKGSDCVSP